MAYDPVYKNDPPERIMEFKYENNGFPGAWMSSFFSHLGDMRGNIARAMYKQGNIDGAFSSSDGLYQRPVLYLSNLYSNVCLYPIGTEVIQSYKDHHAFDLLHIAI